AGRNLVDGARVGRRDVERAVAGEDDGGERSGGGRGRNGSEQRGGAGGGALKNAAIDGVVDVEVAGAVVEGGGGIDRSGRDAGERCHRDSGGGGDDHLRPEAGAAQGNVVGYVAAAVFDFELADAKPEDGGRKGDGDVAGGRAGDGADAGLAGDGEVFVGGAFGEGGDRADRDNVAGGNRKDEGGDAGGVANRHATEVHRAAGRERLCGGRRKPCERKEG